MEAFLILGDGGRPHKNNFFHWKSRRFVLQCGRPGDLIDFRESPGKSGRRGMSDSDSSSLHNT